MRISVHPAARPEIPSYAAIMRFVVHIAHDDNLHRGIRLTHRVNHTAHLPLGPLSAATRRQMHRHNVDTLTVNAPVDDGEVSCQRVAAVGLNSMERIYMQYVWPI